MDLVGHGHQLMGEHAVGIVEVVFAEFLHHHALLHLELFAELVAAREREACAQVCERIYKKMFPDAKQDEVGIEAQIIRARGNNDTR